ncbi:MAG TPA: helicase-related protein, partial [Acidimicrobiales bacterium]|nr:helicase-related protein [Acidimicrobiales bacterium]
FGVEQRATLRGKGESDPDVLVMTATPIPRTAAMTVYGDLDVTVLDELPAGRTPVTTRWASDEDKVAGAFEKIRSEVAAGRQAFVVCPLVRSNVTAADVEGAEVGDVLGGGQEDGQGDLFEDSDGEPGAGERPLPRAAEDEFARLTAPGGELDGLRVGLLHGQLPPRDKESVMADFRDGRLDAVVTTTVIEVGVDVPAATVMVVLDADRFGIAQLHQLRGRVGRGKHRSWCYLVAGDVTPDGEKRLEALVRTNDGFELAETDLELRGEGTVLGARQKGRTDLRLASLRRDRDLVLAARGVAESIVSADHDLSGHPLLADELRLFIDEEEEAFLFKS